MNQQTPEIIPLYFCDLGCGEIWDLSQTAAVFADSLFRCSKAGYTLQDIEEHLADLLLGIVERDPGVLAALESNTDMLPMLLAGLMRGSGAGSVKEEEGMGYVAFLYRFSSTVLVRPGAFRYQGRATVPRALFALAKSMLELDLKYSPQWFDNPDSVRFRVDEMEGVLGR